MKRLFIMSFFFLSSCTGIPDNLQAINGFELQRYLGTWYEIARLDHRFERGLEQVTANYSLREDGGVRVLNRGYDVSQQQWREAEGKAYFLGASDQGRLKVSFFGPFYASYNIVELDENYQYVLVAGNTRNYFWILSRTPKLDAVLLDELLIKARQFGFDTDKLIFVQQQP